MNENDQIREEILKYLYDLSKNARSLSGARANEMMLGRALGAKYRRGEIVSNIMYLVQAGWIKQEKENKTPYFSASTLTVNHFEGPSTFQKSTWVTGINVTNIQGVTVIGDHNFVHQEFNELYRSLDVLNSEVGKSGTLNDEQKLEFQSEIDTIKSQLAKKAPNKSIIGQAWAALSALATVDGVMDFYKTVAPLVDPFLS